MEDQLGQTQFSSWQDFRTFLDTWCEERKVTFTVRHCVLLNDEGVRREVAQVLRYSSVDLACGSCPARKTCPAVIKVRLGLQKDRLVVTHASLQHNHGMVEANPRPETKRNRLLHPAPLANDVSKKFLDTHDLKRLLRSPQGSFGDGTQFLKDLDSLFASDPRAKVKLVFVEDKLLVKSIFIMVSYMQEVAQHFPGSLYVDLLPCFSPDFDLYTVLCEEDISSWKICAYCIARKGASGTLRFILVSIMQSIPKMRTLVQHITLSPEIQDPLDLEALVPHASMRYCMPLLLDLLYQKIAHLDSTAEAQIKNLLHVLAHAQSLKVYNQYLNDLSAVCPTDVYQFFFDTWHPRRAMWVKGDHRNQTIETNIHALVRWKHQAVISQLSESPTLDQCLQVVLNDSDTTFNLVEFVQLPESEEMLELTQQDEDDEANKDGAEAQKNDHDKLEEEEEEREDENLTLMLSEGSDMEEDQIPEGAAEEQLEQGEFYSWADFCSFLDAWCVERNVRFAIRQSMPLGEEEVGPEMARSLKYSIVTMSCRGSNSSTRKKCPATIDLKLASQKDKLVISKTSLWHNHDLQETNLPPQGPARKLMSHASHATKLAFDISRKFLDWSDLSRLLRFHSIPFEEHSQILKELDSLFVSDPGSKVKLVFLEDKLLVKNIFVMTSQMQELVQAFPGHLYVDLLPCFHADFNLYTVLCEDDTACWVVGAYCISRKDMSDSLWLMMVSILQSIPQIGTHVKCVTVSPEVREPQGLETLVPNASVKYCMPLVLDLLYCNISHLDSTTETKIKKDLLTLAHTNSLSVYNRFLNDLKVVCPADIFKYYYDTWHPCWKLWSRGDSSSQDAENRIYNFVKAMHQRFTAHKDPSLHYCLHMILHDCGAVSSSYLQEISVDDSSHLKTEVDSSCQSACLNMMDPFQQQESSSTEESQNYVSQPVAHHQTSDQLTHQELHTVPAPHCLLSNQECYPHPLQESLYLHQEPHPDQDPHPLDGQEPHLLPHQEPHPLSFQELQPLPHQEPLPCQELQPLPHQNPLPRQEPPPPHQEPHPLPILTPTNTRPAYSVTSEARLDGREFHSWDDFCSFLDNCCEEKFLVGLSENLREEDLGPTSRGPELVQSLKYSSVQLSCSRNNCPAFIKLILGPQKDRLVVSQSSFQHNHDLPDTDHPPPSKKSRLSSHVGLPAHIANNISRKFLEPADLVRLLRFRSGAFEDRTQVLSELHSLFTSDPKAKVKLVFVEDKLLVKSIFIMTSRMQDVSQLFSGHLYVDFFSEFSLGFDLYTVLCNQENSGWKVCAFCIAKKNLSDILRFLLVSVFQTMPSMNSSVKHVTVNPGIQEPWELEALLPHSSMSYCVPLLLELLHQKITPQDVAMEAQLKSCLDLLVQTQSSETYAKCLDDLRALCPAQVLQYYEEAWHPRRNRWLQRGEGREEAEWHACALVKCMHQAFVEKTAPAPSLHQCLHVVLNDSHTAELSMSESTQSQKMDTVDSCHPQEMDTTECAEHREIKETKIPVMKEEEEENPGMSLNLATVDSGIQINQASGATDEEELERQEFHSWRDLSSFLDTWCEERNVEFANNQSIPFTEDEINQYPLGSGVARSLKYSSVHLGCSSSSGDSCPAVIRLRLGYQKDKLVIIKSILQHNHELLTTRPLQAKSLPNRIASDISKKFLEPSDLKRLLCLHSSTFEDRSEVLGELDGLFISDPWAKVKLVFVADKGLVKSIFIMTSRMQDIAQRFPGHLYVDLLPGFSPGFDLYMVLCEDYTLQWKVCAYCIVRKGTPNTLRFILVSVMQSIPKMNTWVKYLTLSPEIQDPLDLELVVPHALIRYCLPLVLDIMHQKIAHLDLTTKAQIKNFVHIMAHTCSAKVYYKYLDDLKAVCPTEIFQYYSDIWHPRWKFWVKRDSRSEDAESRARVFLESKHSALVAQVGPLPSLHHCLHVVLSESNVTLDTNGSAHDLEVGTGESPHTPEASVAETFPLQGLEVPDLLHLQNLDTVDASHILEPHIGIKKTPTGTQQTEEAEFPSLEDNEENSYEASLESDIYVNEVSGGPDEERLDRSEFHSWQDFISFLDNWCEERKVMFAIRHSVALSEDEISQYPLGPEIAKSLRYSTVRLCCSICTRRSCPAVIQLRLGPQKDRLVVTKTILQHNHELPMTALPPEMKRGRQLTPTDLPTRIANDISRKFLEPNDIKRLLRYSSGAFEDRSEVLGELNSLFMADPWAKVKLVFVEDKGTVKDIFIMTSHMQDVAQRLPGQLYVELFSNFNPGFDLYTVLCEDESSQWNVCAYCIAKKGISDTLRFTLVSIMQSIPKMNVQVKRITVSPEIQDALDLKALMPNASIGYCTQSVLKILHNTISHLDASLQEQIKDTLEVLAHTHSSALYSQCLNDLVAACPVEIFQYYYDIWHPRRNFWVEEERSDWAAQDGIYNALRAKQRMLVDQAGPVPSLHHCLHIILSSGFMVLDSKEPSQLQEAETTEAAHIPGSSLLDSADSEVTSQPADGGPCSEGEEVDEKGSSVAEVYADLGMSMGQTGDSAATLRGMEFPSWDDFCEFFDCWCKERKELYLIRRASAVKKWTESDLPAKLKYRYVQLVCKASSGSQLGGVSPGNTASTCSAAITVSASKEKNCLVVVRARVDHNHEPDAGEFDNQFTHFRLATGPNLSAEMSSLCRSFLTPQILHELLTESGVLEPALFDCLQELEALFSLDPDARVKLTFLPDTAALESIFLITSPTRSLLQSFPLVLFLGRSLAINETFDLYTVLCEDANGRGRECAYFITRGESRTPIRFMLVWLLRSVPEVKPLIEGLIVRANLKELDLIRDLLPSCCVRMSQTHALDILYRMASLEEPTVQEQLKRLVYNLVHARSPTLYRFYFKELEVASPGAFLRYFRQAWHGRKEDWAESWGHKMRDGHFLEFAAWQPGELRSEGGFPCPLASCIQALLKVTTIQTVEKESGVTVAEQAGSQPTLCSQEGMDLPVDSENPAPCLLPDLLIPDEVVKPQTSDPNTNTPGSDGIDTPAASAPINKEVLSPEVTNEEGILSTASGRNSPELMSQEDAELSTGARNDLDAFSLAISAISPGFVKQEHDGLAFGDPAVLDPSSPLALAQVAAETVQQEMLQHIGSNATGSPASVVPTQPPSGKQQIIYSRTSAARAAQRRPVNDPSATHGAPGLEGQESIPVGGPAVPVRITADSASPDCHAAAPPEPVTRQAVSSSVTSASSERNFWPTPVCSSLLPVTIAEEGLQTARDLKGQEFLSWNEFRDYFDGWCEQNRVLYQIKSYTTIDKVKAAQPISASIMTQLRYSYIRLVCRNAINAYCSKKKSLMETCPSSIVLRAGPDCDRLIIEQAVLEHNHENTEEEFFTHYQRCRLKAKPYFLLEVTNSISKQFLMARELQKLVERSCDEEPILQDLLMELSALFLADSKVKVKLVFYPDEVAVESVFLMTSRMRFLLQRFPSILFLDRSLSVNKNFDLYTMLCEDADGRGRECAYFLAHKESQTPVRFMVVSLMQSIPDVVKPQIKSVVLHTDFTELDLIRALLPKRTVVMSQAHALEALYSVAEQEDTSIRETLKNIIQKLVFSHTPEAFECHVKELEAVSRSGFLAYFLESWYHRKEIWVACWGLKKPERSRFSELVLRHQLALKLALSPPVTLAGCVNGLMRLQSLKVLTSMLNEEKLSALYQSVCPPGSLKLVQEEMSLTKQGCYEVTELEGGFTLNDGISYFHIDKDMACCSCSIYTSSLLPCRHLFATRLWAGEPVFDLKLMQGQ